MIKQSISTNKQGKLEIVLLVAIIKEDKYYVAYCPALELSSYATDMAGAKKAFSQELDIFFEETHRKGTLEKLLLKQGWTLQSKQFQPPFPSAKVMNQLQKYRDVVFKEEKFKIAYA